MALLHWLPVVLILLLHTTLGESTQNSSFAGDFRYSYTQFASIIRYNVLYDSSYDKVVPPSSERQFDHSDAGTDVAVQLRIFKLEEVAVNQATMKIKVWLRMRWQDDRLRWNASNFGGVDNILARMVPEEDAEIWKPDVLFMNAYLPNNAFFEETLARVSSNGEVFWSRPGVIPVMCQ